MAFVTAFLVVLTLTGEPVVNALCIAWCDTQSETMNCDEAIAQIAVPQITAAVGTMCVVILATAPFLREEGRDSGRIAVVAATSVSVVSPWETHPASTQHGGGATGVLRAAPLVLRV